MVADHDIEKGLVGSLWKAWNEQKPVVLLAGSRYSSFPKRLKEECRYFVLGWYAITHFWFYPEGAVIKSAKAGAKQKLRKPDQGCRQFFDCDCVPTDQWIWLQRLVLCSDSSGLRHKVCRGGSQMRPP